MAPPALPPALMYTAARVLTSQMLYAAPCDLPHLVGHLRDVKM